MRVIELASDTDFDGWRKAARDLALQGIAPENVHWRVVGQAHGDLLAGAGDGALDDPVALGSPEARENDENARDENVRASPVQPGGGGPPSSSTFTVPRAFIDAAGRAILHRDPDRFALLYRLLVRLRDEPRLLDVAVDPDVARMQSMLRSVHQAIHKMHAFVRFRAIGAQGAKDGDDRTREAALVANDDPAQEATVSGSGANDDRARDPPLPGSADDDRWYVAWFEPPHHIVEAATPFFARRFANMRWSILTPERSAHWDGRTLRFGPGADRASAPGEDALEDLWRTYYASIFNPARLNPDLMRQHMARRYWSNLPEADIIAPLVASARERMTQMIDAAQEAKAEGAVEDAQRRQRVVAKRAVRKVIPVTTGTRSADEHVMHTESLIEESATLDQVRAAVHNCRNCPLWEPATQAVFGEGSASAPLMLVGEQPGDQEDLAGKPFVGPAGKLLNRALAQAGVDRESAYVTNAVKHFKFIVRGERRLHQKPKVTEVRACHPWIEQELALVQPKYVVALGATAANSLLGRDTPIERNRGHWMPLGNAQLLITVHPSYLLRLPDPQSREREFDRFVADLKLAAEALAA